MVDWVGLLRRFTGLEGWDEDSERKSICHLLFTHQLLSVVGRRLSVVGRRSSVCCLVSRFFSSMFIQENSSMFVSSGMVISIYRGAAMASQGNISSLWHFKDQCRLARFSGKI